MCGIAGIIATDPARLSRERLEKMTQSLAHRGPDGECIWINEQRQAGFGHRRLSVIDLSQQAAQPMHYLQRYTIVHNGEIYNYRELRNTLQQKGYTFRSQSDTEVILAAYDCYQADCLQHFDGMFAFAIWDQQEQLLFAARDRFGEKPFYYYLDQDQLVFASEMKALWAAGIPRQVNDVMLFNFFTLGYTQNPANAEETFYKAVHKLPARSFITYHLPEQRLMHNYYWDIDIHATDHSITDEKAIEQFRLLFSRSVSRRLRSDVALGTSLSGGLDSTSVVAVMQSFTESKINTFSATFPGFEQDESAYIQLAAKNFKCHNYQVQPAADTAISNFEKVCYHQEEPFQSASVIAQYSVYELARSKGVKVLLDGQGADEVLAGYYKYFHWYWQELYRSNKPLLATELAAAGKNNVRDEWGWKNRLAARFPHWAAMYLSRQRRRQQQQHPELTGEFISSYGTSYYHTPHVDKLNGVLYYNTMMNGLEELLRYADRNAMAHGVEVRLPFLYHELVAFIFSLPAAYKIRNGFSKWLLRKSMEPLLPPAITWRTDKIGFEPPQQKWMEDKQWQDYFHEARKHWVAKGIVKPAVLQKKIQPKDVHSAENYDWRYLVASKL